MSESQGCKYTPKTKEELEKLVRDSKVYLGDIDTSYITDMSNLFMCSKRMDFSGIEKWDVSNVTNMSGMFLWEKSFNQPLNTWNVSKVTDMFAMFHGATSFNQPLDSWDVSNVIDMICMFYGAESFNQSLESWNVCSVRNFKSMFAKSAQKILPHWYAKLNWILQ